MCVVLTTLTEAASRAVARDVLSRPGAGTLRVVLHDELESCLAALPSAEARADFQWCVDRAESVIFPTAPEKRPHGSRRPETPLGEAPRCGGKPSGPHATWPNIATCCCAWGTASPTHTRRVRPKPWPKPADWVVRSFRFSPNHRIMLPITAWPCRPGAKPQEDSKCTSHTLSTRRSRSCRSR